MEDVKDVLRRAIDELVPNTWIYEAALERIAELEAALQKIAEQAEPQYPTGTWARDVALEALHKEEASDG